jgi:DNA-binding winged helix-turn-helix (wHTH) protein
MPECPDRFPGRFRFGPFELDEDLCELRCHDRRIPIQRRPLELLRHLIRNRHRVVSKAELLEVVWRGVAVSDAALSSALRDLRRALGDDGRTQHTIRTSHGFGYRFVAELEPAAPATGGDPDRPLEVPAPPGLDPAWWVSFSQRLAAFVTAELASAEGADGPPSGSTPVRLVRVQ